jgi:hypothetical protein
MHELFWRQNPLALLDNCYSRLQKFVQVLRNGGARFVLAVVYAVERAPQPATPRPDLFTILQPPMGISEHISKVLYSRECGTREKLNRIPWIREP